MYQDYQHVPPPPLPRLDALMAEQSVFTESHACTLNVVFTDGRVASVNGIHDESMKMENGLLVAEDTNIRNTRIFYFPNVSYWFTRV